MCGSVRKRGRRRRGKGRLAIWIDSVMYVGSRDYASIMTEDGSRPAIFPKEKKRENRATKPQAHSGTPMFGATRKSPTGQGSVVTHTIARRKARARCSRAANATETHQVGGSCNVPSLGIAGHQAIAIRSQRADESWRMSLPSSWQSTLARLRVCKQSRKRNGDGHTRQTWK
jgi:hypothetical protein